MDAAKRVYLNNVEVNFFDADNATVDAAKNVNSTNLVKNEELNFVEVECDPFGSDDDNNSVEDVLASDFVVTNIEASEDSENESNAQQTDEEAANYSNDDSGASAFASKEDSKRSGAKEFDHLISNCLNMICDVCDHSFETLSDLLKHYRDIHHQDRVQMQCCDRQMDLYDIRDHIQSHLYPDDYK